jgi:hypothetical protein
MYHSNGHWHYNSIMLSLKMSNVISFYCSNVRLFNSSLYLHGMPDFNKSKKKILPVQKETDPPGSINPEYRKKTGEILPACTYADGIRNGDRTLLSRAITLIESSKPENRNLGLDVLEKCLPDTGNSIRIGITGVPGVGKSTFIDSMGKHLISEGKKERFLLLIRAAPGAGAASW